LIVVYHLNHKIVEVVSLENLRIDFNKNDTIAAGIQKIAKLFPTKKIVWCHLESKQNLNLETINTVFHHKKMLFSYCPDQTDYFFGKIGYADESPYIKINKKVTFSTWQMSSWVGVVHAETLLALANKIPLDKDFDFYLCSIAKLVMPLGVECFSEPSLLLNTDNHKIQKASDFTLFRFVKQHYRVRWVFLLLFNLMIYQKKFPFTPFLRSLFYKRRSNKNLNLEAIKVQSSRKVVQTKTIDVIIPTIGRKDFLKDFLKDLSIQTHLPKTVIIVEQNPVEGSVSELNYIDNENWPFEIKHLFIHQAGACNARNVALKGISSEWVFFADDDIRIEPTFLENALEKCNTFGAKIVSFSCLQKGQNKIYKRIFQWVTFGSGCSLVLSECLQGCAFNIGYEFGYGEDGDFGMQLRNKGYDILYLPEPEILHLKAPIGGFRTKPQLQWENESIQPKPSPTIMLYFTSHYTKQQIRGYKTILFIKNYNFKSFQNPIRYYIEMNKKWKVSVFWANKLNKQNEI
jgi:glycosyltransferase involved in cell wall biosynthesis